MSDSALNPKQAPANSLGLTPYEVVSARNLVVHHQNKMLKKAVVGQFAFIILALAIIAVLATREPKDNFFATTPNGVITRIEPMDQPMLSNAQVASFGVEAVTETMSLTYVDYEKVLSESQEYYRPDSFRSVHDAIRNSGYLKTVVDGFFIATAIASEAPQIIREGKRGGVYAWEIKFPLNVKLQSRDGLKIQNFDVIVVVERAPADLRPRCVAVTKLGLVPRA